MKPDIKDILEDGKNIAIIGCSNKPHRTSCKIAKYLQDHGYKIIPIHPDYEEVLGEKTYPAVYDIPQNIQVDIVDIFRDSAYTADMVDDIIKWQEQTGQRPVVWTQLRVSSPEAREKAESAGLPYVENKCIMVEHRNRVAQ